MPNLLLTEVCVRKCPYCFAKQYMADIEDHTAITKENLIYTVDFLEKSGIKYISLLGGEPLIHPQISEIIKYLIIERDFNVTIFTSGIMPGNRAKKFIEDIMILPDEKKKFLSFVVNVNEPWLSPKSELKKVHYFLSSLPNLCALSFNIYRLDYNIDFLIEYILRYGLKRQVRFGIANPIPGSKNQFLAPSDFKSAKRTLMNTLEKMYELAIYTSLDCGFPMCMFTDEDLGKLIKFTRNRLSFECVPAVDIGPDLSCWSCFPLSNINKKSLKDFSTFEDLYSYFSIEQNRYRKEINGIFQACDTCRNFKDNLCHGGCLAHILNTFYQEGNIRF